MNKQDEDKAREIAVKWRAKGLPYNAIYDSTLKMAAWKEQQMIEKMINWLALHAELYGSFNGRKLNEMAIAMKKAMEEN